ncbi:MAG: DNA gyrase C-terminal beta-propeller domain-containing protein [Pyrinomonadaceae bacterium]
MRTVAEIKTWRGAPADKDGGGFCKELEKVVGGLQFSDIQAQAILDLQLRRLSALERQKIIDELEGDFETHLANSKRFLTNETLLRQVIIDELQEVRRNFGDERRTQIVDAGIELKIEDLIADEEVAITVTNAGYIKRTPVSAYSTQGRGGKGRFGAKAKNEDFVEHLFTASTHDFLMIFTDDGQVFKIKVHEIPEADTAARGKALVNLIQHFDGAQTRRSSARQRFYRRRLRRDGYEKRHRQENFACRFIKTFAPTASTPSTSTTATSF